MGDKMKKFEKYTIASLGGAIFFSLWNVNIIIGSLILLACILIANIDKKKIYCLFIGIPFFVGSLITLNKEMEIGEIYKAKITIDKKIEIDISKFSWDNRIKQWLKGISKWVKIKNLKRIEDLSVDKIMNEFKKVLEIE